jgi:hypothetical protein
VLVSIHVVARLFRLPVLRIDGDVVLLDDDRLGHTAVDGQPHRRELTAGRLLALAEAELAAVDDRRGKRPAVVSGSAPAGRLRERAP